MATTFKLKTGYVEGRHHRMTDAGEFQNLKPAIAQGEAWLRGAEPNLRRSFWVENEDGYKLAKGMTPEVQPEPTPSPIISPDDQEPTAA